MPAKIPPFMRLMNGYRESKESGCWIWTGHKYPNGYGAIKAFGKMVLAHRLSYELHNGPIPDDLHILHSCDVRSCVNPSHLRVGTHAENMQEAKDRGRMRSGVNHPMFGKTFKRPRQANQVMVLGVLYESQKAAERALGLGAGSVRYWIKNRPDKAHIIKRGSEYQEKDSI